MSGRTFGFLIVTCGLAIGGALDHNPALVASMTAASLIILALSEDRRRP